MSIQNSSATATARWRDVVALPERWKRPPVARAFSCSIFFSPLPKVLLGFLDAHFGLQEDVNVDIVGRFGHSLDWLVHSE